jgi:succinoglycan biosynthesis transport protein ExoP
VTLGQFAHLLRRSWLAVLVIALAVSAVAIASTFIQTKEYQATTKVFVAAQSAPSITDLSQGNTFTQQVVQSYADIVNTPIVLDSVIEDLGLSTTSANLSERVEASVATDTVLITISVVDESPDRAAAIANSVAENLAAEVDELSPKTLAGDSPVKITTVQEAVAPDGPSSPNLPLYIIVGLLLGLAIGVGAVVTRALADTRTRSPQDLANITSAPLLGTIFAHDESDTKPLVFQHEPRSGHSEAFRALRTNLEFLNYGGRDKCFVFTSALPGEGKSTTISNLALAFTDIGESVCVVDADLRRPRIAEIFQIEGAVGLSDVLIGRASLADTLQTWGGRSLALLPAGQLPPNPSELLASPAMKDVLTTLTAQFDRVLIDAPPLLPVTDAAILSKRSGGAVLISAIKRANRHQITAALGVLGSVDADVLGTVVTMVPTRGSDARVYGYGTYGTGLAETNTSPDDGKKVAKPGRRRLGSEPRVKVGSS